MIVTLSLSQALSPLTVRLEGGFQVQVRPGPADGPITPVVTRIFKLYIYLLLALTHSDTITSKGKVQIKTFPKKKNA